MSLFELPGTITAIGQSAFSNDVAVHAHLEISATTDGVRWWRKSASAMTWDRSWS